MEEKEKNKKEKQKEKPEEVTEVSEENAEEAKESPEEKAPEKTREQELEEKIKEQDDKYLRLLAEYDNFRKRSQKEKADIYASSKSEVIEKILPILDNFERAAQNSEADFEGYKKGIELIFGQFLKVLESFGVESFGEEGDAFDPNLHNAVMAVQDDSLGENVVAQVFGKGYKLGDKIIREAAVKVANT